MYGVKYVTGNWNLQRQSVISGSAPTRRTQDECRMMDCQRDCQVGIPPRAERVVLLEEIGEKLWIRTLGSDDYRRETGI